MAARVVSGVYAIRCKVTGDCYIGGSSDTWRRWLIHRSELRRGKHHSKPMQEAWNQYGEDNFGFEVLEEVEPRRRGQPGDEYDDFIPIFRAEKRYLVQQQPAYNGYTVVRRRL